MLIQLHDYVIFLSILCLKELLDLSVLLIPTIFVTLSDSAISAHVDNEDLDDIECTRCHS